MNANDIELALRARATFNDSVECIDADTRHRLRALRLRAQAGEPPRTGMRWILPAGALLFAACGLLVLVPRMSHAPVASAPTARVAAAQPVAPATTVQRNPGIADARTTKPDSLDAVDPDMLSDLEFYGWLAKQPALDASGG